MRKGADSGGLAAQGVNRIESALGWDQAVCKRANARAEERGGALVDNPRWVRILAITPGNSDLPAGDRNRSRVRAVEPTPAAGPTPPLAISPYNAYAINKGWSATSLYSTTFCQPF